MVEPSDARPALSRRVAGQGALLFSGFATAQALSFLRNALLGHWLAKGDFGIAATLTLLLQLVEILTDLGADRLVVQAKDGDEPRFVANAHAFLVARGVLTGCLIYLAAAPVAQFFAIPEAKWAFETIALVPVIRGFLHLDVRRAQRRLENGPFLLTEVVPQAVALGLALPALLWLPDYSVVVWLSLTSATVTVLLSHLLAERSYALAVDGDILNRLIAFGWPIWVSAFPLIAVFQGDRIIVGRLLGMEQLASYTAAFMITMVPGLIAAKVGQSLVLPLLSEVRDNKQLFFARFNTSVETTALVAALYLVTFVIAGGVIVPLAFGDNYHGTGTVAGWLALMWALRMLQAVPGMALMATGETRPFAVAGFLRATALAPALFLALRGSSLEAVASAGAGGELLSMIYMTRRLDALHAGLARAFAARALFLALPATMALLVVASMPADAGLVASIGAVLATTGCVTGLAAALLPSLRTLSRAAADRIQLNQASSSR